VPETREPHIPTEPTFRARSYPLAPLPAYRMGTELSSLPPRELSLWGHLWARLPQHLPYHLKVELVAAVASSHRVHSLSSDLQNDLMNRSQQVSQQAQALARKCSTIPDPPQPEPSSS
jgi:hypothetical protein